MPETPLSPERQRFGEREAALKANLEQLHNYYQMQKANGIPGPEALKHARALFKDFKDINGATY